MPPDDRAYIRVRTRSHCPCGAGIPDFPPLALQSSTRVGDFELVREIGRGGFGEVWVVNQATPKRQLAMKFIDTRHFANTPSEIDHSDIFRVTTTPRRKALT